MTGDPSQPGGSSTSLPRRSSGSRRSGAGSSTSPSTGSALRELAARYGVRPNKALGQHFLLDPNLARAIAADAEIGPRSRVVEVGAGLGSLTFALASTGAEVLAIEFDRALLPPLSEAVHGLDRVRVVGADATALDWDAVLGDGAWTMVANLPYNVATRIVLTVLEDVASVRRLVVMVQREMGERLVARPGEDGYGPTTLRVGYQARGAVIRHVPPAVFWPRPAVGSVVMRLDRLDEPPVDVSQDMLFRVVDEAFGQRRKTIRTAMRRLCGDGPSADAAVAAAGVAPSARAESLSLADFGRLARTLPPGAGAA
jgi:16S rRNA (adenine1518-N6/adenine1519-N6)-dimethyltransferase